jgi:hypothetical protein
MHAIKVDGLGQVTGNTNVIGSPLETLGIERREGNDGHFSQRLNFADPARSSQAV